MKEFEGQVAVITGAAQGIGYATAERLKNEGAQLMIWDLDKKLGNEAAEKLDCDFIQMDMTNDKVVKECKDETLKRHKKIDILVCSAGIAGPTMPTWDYPVDEWLKVINVNVNGVYYCNRHVIKAMRNQGYGFAYYIILKTFEHFDTTILSGFVFGLISVIIPWLFFLPATGKGLMGNKTPNPNLTKLLSICSHIVVGIFLAIRFSYLGY